MADAFVDAAAPDEFLGVAEKQCSMDELIRAERMEDHVLVRIRSELKNELNTCTYSYRILVSVSEISGNYFRKLWQQILHIVFIFMKTFIIREIPIKFINIE